MLRVVLGTNVFVSGLLKPVLGLQADEIARFVLELRAQADVVEPVDLGLDYPRDPEDIPVLATLIASGGDLIVSGDGDLLALRDRYPVETPAEFARRL